MNIYNKIQKSKKTQLAVLIDPDKFSVKSLNKIANYAEKSLIDFIFVGGSITHSNIEKSIITLKQKTTKPIILFPGNIMQISNKADAILFLSLISGRNSELLIGNHVISAKFLKKSKLEVIPTGYILIESGKTTSVEYISNTKPIPADKPDIATSTAIAGELLGLKLIYLEAGSGAKNTINTKMISEVKKNISIPLIVGGGIKTKENFIAAKNAGADVIVVGTAIEKNISIIEEFYY